MKNKINNLKNNISLLITISVVVLLIILNLLALRQILQYRTYYFKHIEENNEQLDTVKDFEKLKVVISLMIRNSELNIKNNFSVTDSSGKSISFSKLIRDKKVLVFRYSQLSCTSCVDVQLQRLEQFAKRIGFDRVIVLTTYTSIKELNMYKKVNNLSFDMYNIPIGTLKTEMELSNTPYFFTVNINKHIENIFIPIKTIPELTEEYYSHIEKFILKI